MKMFLKSTSSLSNPIIKNCLNDADRKCSLGSILLQHLFYGVAQKRKALTVLVGSHSH